MRFWRGLVVVLAWTVWPLIVAGINLTLTPGATCVDDAACARGASLATAALWILLAVAPGAFAVVWWRRWRRTRP